VCSGSRSWVRGLAAPSVLRAGLRRACTRAHGTEARVGAPGSVGSVGFGGLLGPGDGPLVHHPR
jgi:hypothetical protein